MPAPISGTLPPRPPARGVPLPTTGIEFNIEAKESAAAVPLLSVSEDDDDDDAGEREDDGRGWLGGGGGGAAAWELGDAVFLSEASRAAGVTTGISGLAVAAVAPCA